MIARLARLERASLFAALRSEDPVRDRFRDGKFVEGWMVWLRSANGGLRSVDTRFQFIQTRVYRVEARVDGGQVHRRPLRLEKLCDLLCERFGTTHFLR